MLCVRRSVRSQLLVFVLPQWLTSHLAWALRQRVVSPSGNTHYDERASPSLPQTIALVNEHYQIVRATSQFTFFVTETNGSRTSH